MPVCTINFSLIVAMTPDGTIGNKNQIPWHIPSDLRRFKKITTDIGTMVMGRATYQSILERNGGPLPGRYHIVLSKDCSFPRTECVEFVASVQEAIIAIRARSDKACIIGGGKTYALFLPYVQTAYVTMVDASIDGDTSFPGKFLSPEWENVGAFRSFKHDPEDEYATAYIEFRRTCIPADTLVCQ
jgi:dihydrofolate reductase